MSINLLLMPLTGCQGPKVEQRPNWGSCDYPALAEALQPRAHAELQKPVARRSPDAGVAILDYASACLAAGRVDEAQRALYEGILLTNDMTIGEAEGQASLVWAEERKVWQGEAYERSMIEFLHGVCLMQQGDFANARVAFDRAIMTDHFSSGAVEGWEGRSDKKKGFIPNDEVAGRGSVFQRDFLAAYVLRTLCYVRQGRARRAEESWQECREVAGECRTAAARGAGASSRTTWTGPDGRYVYPNHFLPPVGTLTEEAEAVFRLGVDDLGKANLVVVAGTGSRPLKVKTGGQSGGGRVKFVHDAYCAPRESIKEMHLRLDGAYAGRMTQCLNLFGQVAGRGPSLKDLAQQRKEVVEDIGEFLQQHGVFGLQYAGMLVQLVNEEEADVRQWSLLPNAIHLWLGCVPPGEHRLCCLPVGANAPVVDPAVDRLVSSAIEAEERVYVSSVFARLGQSGGSAVPLANRHLQVTTIQVPQREVITVFVPEWYDRQVKQCEMGEPHVYPMLPRHQAPKAATASAG